MDKSKRKTTKILLAGAGAFIITPTRLANEILEKTQEYQNTKEKILSSVEPKSSRYNNKSETKINSKEYCTPQEIHNYLEVALSETPLPNYFTIPILKRWIYTESRFNPNAHNKKTGAAGLTQIREIAWREVGMQEDFEKSWSNPLINTRAGLKYLKWGHEFSKYNHPNWHSLDEINKMKTTFAVYNAGPTRMKGLDFVISNGPRQTKNYVKLVDMAIN